MGRSATVEKNIESQSPFGERNDGCEVEGAVIAIACVTLVMRAVALRSMWNARWRQCGTRRRDFPTNVALVVCARVVAISAVV